MTVQEVIQGFRLSLQQELLWSQCPAGPGAAVAAVRITGKVDRAVLRAALERVVARHEILRTSFRSPGGLAAPLQVVGEGGIAWREEALGAGLETLLQRALEEPLDLAAGTSLRALLVTPAVAAAPDERLLVLALPALCSDAPSLDLLVREIAREAAGLPQPAPLQYIDVSEWQRELLASGEDDEVWRRLDLSGVDGWRLPFAERAAADGAPPVEVTLDLGHETFAAVQRLATAQGAEASDVFLAAWGAVLARLAGAHRVVVGTLFDGRNFEGLGEVIGPLARRLPIPCEADGAPFAELLKTTAEAVRDARRWQESFPPDRLAQAGASGWLAGFAWEERPPAMEAGGLRFALLARRVAAEACDLELACEAAAGAVDVRLRARLPRGAAESLAAIWRTALIGALAEPASPADDLELLAGVERRRLLVELNATAAPAAFRPLHQLLAEQAARTPGAPAVTCGGRILTHAELDAAANRLARHLRRCGAGPDTIVAIALERSPELLIALLGTLKAGAAYLPLDPGQPRERLERMLDDSAAPLRITAPGFRHRLGSGPARVVDLERDRAEIERESAADPAVEVAPESLAYVLYTSGSTGGPKGVMVPHGGLSNYLAWALLAYPAAAGEGSPVHSSIGFDLTVTSLFLPLLAGRCALLLPEEGASGLAEALRTGSFGVVKLTPAHLEVLPELLPPEAAAGCARALVVGGEALTAERLRFWAENAPGVRVFNEYGPTEAVVGCCVHEWAAGAAGPVPIGRPIANTRLYVADRRMRPGPAGVPGELCIGGAGLARGYLGRPGLTAERFVPNPFAGEGSGAAGERLYRTGDLVRHLADGELEYLGRIDDQVKIRGHRLEPGEIEAALAAHPGVAQAAVVAPTDAAGGRRLVAFLAGSGVDAEELRRFLAERLPASMVPAAFVALPSLPLTPNGKVDRRALLDASRAAAPERPELEVPFAPPHDADEELLAEVWAQVLGVARVGVDDNFFALGGDSIRSIQVRSEAARRDVHLTTQQLFQHPTVRALARELRRTAGEAEPAPVAPFSLLEEEDLRRLPPGIEDAYPLSRLQAGMVFHSEYAPETAVYHDQYSFQVRGPLDPAALTAALRRLAARHPVLRTSFALSGHREPLQLVHREVEIPLAFHDLRGLSGEEQREALAEEFEAEKHRGFEWSRPPLLRLRVHRRDESSFQLGLGFHHAILDGWSAASLLSELFRHYLFLVSGEGTPVAALPGVAYRDFIAAERRALASDATRSYWSAVLASDLPPSFLPPAEDSRGVLDLRLRFVDLPEEVSGGLQRAAAREGLPLKSLLLAAHLRVMSLLAGEDEAVTGLVSNGRPEAAGGEQVLGLFLNTLPLRLRLRGGTWLALARDAFAAERALLPHRRFPYSELQRMKKGQALFETVFNFVHFHVYRSLDGLRGLQVVDGRSFEEANFPFAANFSIEQPGPRVRLHFDYDGSRLGEDRIEAVSRRYARALASLAADPEARYELDPLLAPEEQAQVLAAGDGEAAPCPSACVHEWIAAQAAEHPAAVAVAASGERLTYAELDLRANRLAHRLIRLGVGPEVRVGICLRRSPRLPVAILGVLKAGGAYVPLDPGHPADRLAWTLGDAGVNALISEAGAAPDLHGALPQVLLDAEERALAGERAADPGPRARPGNAVYVIYTSGSTGVPKGVVALHAGLANFARAVVAAVGLGPGHAMLQFAPVSFDASALQIFPTLIAGATLVLHPRPAELTGGEILDLCVRERVTVLDLPGAVWRQWVEEMAARREPLPSSLAAYLTGGERLASETLRRWAELCPEEARFLSSYGPTEATVTTAFFTLSGREARSDRADLPAAPLGRPLPGARIRLLDRHLQPVPPEVPGEIFIGGLGLARGYLGLPSLTAERFVPDPFAADPGGRLYRTGDLARCRDGGGLEFLGRTDLQIKIRGFRVEPGEIEAALARHPAVRQAVVVGRREPSGSLGLAAYVVVDGEVGSQELKELLRASLPEPMVPSWIVQLAELPVTPNGKLNRGALPDPAAAAERSAHFVAPRDPLEQILAEIWGQVLKVERVGAFDNFFELGGHSLMATQTLARIRQAFEIDLQLRSLFEEPTVAGLASLLRSSPDADKVEKTATLRIALAGLSEEEVEALLLADAAAETEVPS